MKFLLSALTALFACFASFITASADELMTDGGFEAPAVSGRTPKAKGADFSNSGKGPQWMLFELVPAAGKDAPVSAGLSDELARSGKQSLYVEFNKVTRPHFGVVFQTRMIPVASGTTYRVSLWGRLDAKNPITFKQNQRTPYVKVQVDFFSKNGTENVGESAYSVLPIPGSPDSKRKFTADNWTEFLAEATTPEDAGFMQVAWQCETSTGEGEANGAIFFDDASIAGPAAPDPKATPDPNATPSPVLDEEAAAAMQEGPPSPDEVQSEEPSPAGSPAASVSPAPSAKSVKPASSPSAHGASKPSPSPSVSPKKR